jgi:hypothetical protein
MGMRLACPHTIYSIRKHNNIEKHKILFPTFIEMNSKITKK